MSDNRTADLWLKIDQLHLKFLQAEETPAKLEIRKKLEGLVAEYLSLVPHERKFVSGTTGDLVANSAKWKPDFSLVKAANAFRAVEQYAANLINQPWRSFGVLGNTLDSTNIVWKQLCLDLRNCS